MGIPIKGLTSKFRLLRAYGGYRGVQTLAHEFGVSPTTLYGWGSGRRGRGNRDQLPAHHLPKLLDIAGRCLGGGYSVERVRELVIGPLGEFETALGSGARSTLVILAETEGRRAGFRFEVKPGQNLGLADTDDVEEPEADFSVARGVWFRFEVPTPLRSQHAVALQNAGHRWSVFPAEVDLRDGVVRVPGRKRDGGFGYLREREQSGFSRYIVIQAPAPAPAGLMNYFHGRVELDMAALNLAAAFYEEQNPVRRALFVADIQVTED